ncbi:hypothetical protein MXB_4170 [Myxobolus squamalis]|nr:hypothetical protein MXB_4170 [Myxobolus squamalis]
MALNYIKREKTDIFKLGKCGRIIVSDINQKMLDFGKKRANSLKIDGFEWIVADAAKLPFESATIDAVTMSFGLRNCPEPEKVLFEAHRVLKTGGRFMCLEFSDVENPVLSTLYDLYSYNIIPVLGTLIASDWDAYQYLVESIRMFYTKKELASVMENVGFKMVAYEKLLGGIVCIHKGYNL